MSAQKYLAITGGVGGAKLALGLANLLDGGQLAFAVNTADDFEHLGLHISPDIDTLVYTLAGDNNPDTGWGRKNESWNFLQALKEIGGEGWFALGDRDLALIVERTHRLRNGQALSGVTADLAARLGVTHPVLPMTDDAVATRVMTPAGEMDFQDYFVRLKCEPNVTGFRFAGVEDARLNPEIAARLQDPELAGVILCPSNPFVSIDPILALPGMQGLLRACAAPVIAVSPVVGGAAIKGPTVKMMTELSVPNSAAWVARHYRPLLDGFVLDRADAALKDEIESLGLHASVTETVMVTLEDRIALARHCLELLGALRA